MSFIKMLLRLANLKHFPLVLSFILILPFSHYLWASYETQKIKFADAVMGYWGLEEGLLTVYTYDEKDFKKISGLQVRRPSLGNIRPTVEALSH
jgi:predicted nucleic acid-binding protein